MFVDDEFLVAYVGSQPVAVLDLSTPAPTVRRLIDLGGPVVAVRFTSASVVLAYFAANSSVPQVATLPRGRSSFTAAPNALKPAARRLLQQPATLVCRASNGRLTVAVTSSNLITVYSADGLAVVTLASSAHPLASVAHCDVGSAGGSDYVVVSGSTATSSWTVGYASSVGGVVQPMTFFTSANVRLPVSLPEPQNAPRCSCLGTQPRVVCVLKCNDGAYLASFQPIAGSEVSAVQLVETALPVNATAMAFDESGPSSFVLVALNSVQEPSSLYRVNHNTLTLRSKYEFKEIGADREIVVALASNSTTRELYAIVKTTYQLRWVSVNLFGILEVTPSVIDSAGTATVTVVGEGFARIALPDCRV